MMTHELIVDNFAGGGGASTGIEAALGRPVDIAVNHDPAAIAMHKVNHPGTTHLCESVWKVDPVEVCGGRPVGLAWFSPDCTHFSKAKGGKPVKKTIRGLAWVVLRWAAKKKPRIIMLENVEEFVTWGPLVKKEDGNHYPCPKRKGRTFRTFVNALKRHGYAVEFKTLRACDYGAPTIRKRLFMVARCDGQPIVWPEPTHADPKSEAVKSGRLKPWRTAAECIDWSIPCPSIFERKKPLAEATLRRIAKGIMKYVVNSPEPFIVTYYGDKGGEFRGQDLGEPLRTQTTENRHGLVMPFIARTDMHKSNAGCVYDIKDPLRTVTTGGGHAVVASTLIQTGYGEREGQSPRVPGLDEPLHTVTAGGTHFGEVRAFLVKYYGNEKDGVSLTEPMHTVVSKDRFGLVTVSGQGYMIADIGMRMLQPRELFRAQGFPDAYIVDRDAEGKPFTKTEQVAKCGNSVPPPFSEALVRANYRAKVSSSSRHQKRINDFNQVQNYLPLGF